MGRVWKFATARKEVAKLLVEFLDDPRDVVREVVCSTGVLQLVALDKKADMLKKLMDVFENDPREHNRRQVGESLMLYTRHVAEKERDAMVVFFERVAADEKQTDYVRARARVGARGCKK